MSDPHLQQDRGDYKLKAARRHLDNLRQVEAAAGSLVSSNDRMHVEMEIDEFLYQLIGVKDALLQEINCEFHLGIALDKVGIGEVNRELYQKRPDARDVTEEICSMLSAPQNSLWLVNYFHNHSKHRTIIGKAINMVIGGSKEGITVAFIDPRTNSPLRTNEGKQKPIIEYLEESYAGIEELQKIVRDKISRYCNSAGT
jgi:hypothetical protein